ncbi:CBS domain-containing protein [Streptomyces sp. SID5785]|nr:CBS domain-containing protein [Streptomyces sp. SID5785]MZD10458.1 CBS domain-containing protein [Streptomyces sp. SID5785]
MGIDTAAARVAAGTDEDPDTGVQLLYPVLDRTGLLSGVVTRSRLLGAGPDDIRPLSALAQPPVVAHPDETLRTVANRMAAHHVTRVVVTPRDEPGRVDGILSLGQLLEARRVDLHEEQHVERVFRRRREPAGVR